jgi:hypothetical protein
MRILMAVVAVALVLAPAADAKTPIDRWQRRTSSAANGK